MAYYICNLYDESRLHFGLQNDLFLMQYQYESENKATVSTMWGTAGRVREGDWLVAYFSNPPRCWAIGKARKPRMEANHDDTIARTTNDRSHTYDCGIIKFSDAEVFYENLNNDNGWDKPWGQRIDVEKWLHIANPAIDPGSITDHMINGAHPTNTIYEIDEDLFNYISLQLRNGSQNKLFIDISKLPQPQAILTGPPGTGKTYEAKILAATILDYPQGAATDKTNPKYTNFHQDYGITWNIVQFHPSYNYEDFVRGIQVSTDDKGNIIYETVNRIFAQMAQVAHSAYERNKDNPQKYVLIIDEINRAHLAAVLGELIYGLEYRGEKITTPYSIPDQFDGDPSTIIVPPNLYIIGTMNTADRSIGHIDYAVRRRFAFIPLLPDREKLKNFYKEKGYSHSKDALALFDSVSKLFRDGDKNQLSPEFYADDVQPGHTYFMAKTVEELDAKFEYQVKPLLHEYIKDGILNMKIEDLENHLKTISNTVNNSPAQNADHA